MSIENSTSLMTSYQIKNRLISVSTDMPDIKNKLLNSVEKFQCLDNIAKSVGLVRNEFSFANRVSWNSILSTLATSGSDMKDINLSDINKIVLQSSNELKNNIIPKLQKLRNSWMLNVILIELIFLGLLTSLVAAATHVMGMWSLSNISFPIEAWIYERPIFIFLASILLFIGLVRGHFSVRNFASGQIVKRLNKEESEFDFAAAFLKNTRMQHSIFRPDIIGWGWLSRKCLLKSKLIKS